MSDKESEQRTPVMTGGCQCGAVRYALYAEPEGTHFCHCRMCQKAVGNVFAALAPVRRADFAWTCGEGSIYRSSTIAERGFCPRCGTPLTFAYVDRDWIDVTVGSLDEPARTPIIAQHGVESRVPWLRLDHDLPEDRTEEEMPAERLARLESFQHPDHERQREPS